MHDADNMKCDKIEIILPTNYVLLEVRLDKLFVVHPDNARRRPRKGEHS